MELEGGGHEGGAGSWGNWEGGRGVGGARRGWRVANVCALRAGRGGALGEGAAWRSAMRRGARSSGESRRIACCSCALSCEVSGRRLYTSRPSPAASALSSMTACGQPGGMSMYCGASAQAVAAARTRDKAVCFMAFPGGEWMANSSMKRRGRHLYNHPPEASYGVAPPDRAP